MFQGRHLHLKCHPPLFCNFKWFSFNVATPHHPVFWQEVDELLAKRATELSAEGVGFYSNVFVVPKHIGALLFLLNLQ